MQKVNYQKVLFIGPYANCLKGGIVSVLISYKEFLGNNFNVFSTVFAENKIKNSILFLLQVIKFSSEGKNYDILHFHTSAGGSFYRKAILILISKIFQHKGKKIIHIHSGRFYNFFQQYKWRKKFIIYILNQAQAIIFLSEETKKQIEKSIKSPTYLLNNPIPEKTYKEKQLQYPLQMIFLGKICKEKGIFDLVEAINEHKSTLSGKVQLIIGGYGNVEELKKQIRQHQLQDVIEYKGWLGTSEKTQLLENSQIMVLPSYSEAMPISILEGMSFSMPIIASKVGAIPKLVDAENGFLIKPGNKVEMISAIKFYIHQTEKINFHGRASYNKSKAYFTENTLEELDNIYRQL